MWPLFANFAGLRLRPSSAGSGSAPPPQAVAPPFLRLLCSPQAVARPSSAGSGSALPPQAVARPFSAFSVLCRQWLALSPPSLFSAGSGSPFLRLLCSPQAVASPFLRLLCSQQAVAPPLQSKKPKSKK